MNCCNVTAGIGRHSGDTAGVAGYSIAIGNCAGFMRGQADSVTQSNEEEGWVHAVDNFILLHDEEPD